MKYYILISKLEKIIENWYEKDILVSLIEEPYDGLCDNIRNQSHKEIPDEVFDSWVYFSGDARYPVGGEEEYGDDQKEPYSLFKNPKRLHLAVHMLQWLRYHSVKGDLKCGT